MTSQGKPPEPKPWAIHPGGRLHTPYKVFTWAISLTAGAVYLGFYLPEKNPDGRDHALSDFKRWMEKQKDRFFEIDE